MRMPAMMYKYKKLQLQRQSSDDTESSSSCCSRSSTAHRRTPSFIGAIQFDSSEEEDVWRHDPTKDMSFRSAPYVHKDHHCSPESKVDLKHRLDGDNETLRVLELIRELSFDFGCSGPKLRASISSTDSTASSSECDTSSHTDTRHDNADHIDTSPIGLDPKLKHIIPCVSYSRMDSSNSSSSLIGLKYLPDDW
ncbi:hypothetical protein ACHAWC_001879 [Mediolabrus comicus]